MNAASQSKFGRHFLRLLRRCVHDFSRFCIAIRAYNQLMGNMIFFSVFIIIGVIFAGMLLRDAWWVHRRKTLNHWQRQAMVDGVRPGFPVVATRRRQELNS